MKALAAFRSRATNVLQRRRRSFLLSASRLTLWIKTYFGTVLGILRIFDTRIDNLIARCNVPLEAERPYMALFWGRFVFFSSPSCTYILLCAIRHLLPMMVLLGATAPAMYFEIERKKKAETARESRVF